VGDPGKARRAAVAIGPGASPAPSVAHIHTCRFPWAQPRQATARRLTRAPAPAPARGPQKNGEKKLRSQLTHTVEWNNVRAHRPRPQRPRPKPRFFRALSPRYRLRARRSPAARAARAPQRATSAAERPGWRARAPAQAL
jgi:hypothetical protein